MAEKYEIKTIDYVPGRRFGGGSQKKFDRLIADGWELVTQKNRFGGVTTATLRREKPSK